jgi:hypothetical protein
MTPGQIQVYTEEVYIHASIALREYDEFRAIVEEPSTRQAREAWMRLQSFLSHFGMVSKLLYAPSARKAISRERAQALREHLGIGEDSALNDRDARNAIEHLDERLDNWLEQGDNGVLECVFESHADFTYINTDNLVVRRVYLIEEDVFVTSESDGQKEMPLTPVVAELRTLMDQCRQTLTENNSYQYVGA